MRVAIVSSLASLSEGGLAYSIPNMKCILNEYTAEKVEIFAPSQQRSCSSQFGNAVTPDVYLSKSFRFSPKLIGEICKWQPDLIDIQGLWTYHIIASYIAAQRLKIPYIITPRGMLDGWALKQRSIKKSIATVCYQKFILSSAAGFRVTSERELKNIGELSINNNAYLIPNSLDATAMSSSKNFDRQKTVMFLSRIHYKKGIKDLLEAWSRVQLIEPEWKLEIYGDYDNEFGRKYRSKAQYRDKNIFWKGPVYDDRKIEAFKSSGIFVFPTYSENFSNVVLEALSNGLPVVTTLGASWGDVEKLGFGWLCDNNPTSIANKIVIAIKAGSNAREKMGELGREYVLRNYAGELIATKLSQLYQKILTK